MNNPKGKLILTIIALLILTTMVSSCDTTFMAGDPDPGSITGRVFLDEDADDECDLCDCDFYLEDITIELYRGTCTATKFMQLAETDSEGVFLFEDLEPGEYCVMPRVKTICEGYQPTTPIQQHVMVESNETVEADWFGFDHALDIND